MLHLQDGGQSLLEAAAQKQGESDGDQDVDASDALLASNTDQAMFYLTALHTGASPAYSWHAAVT